MSQPAQVVKVRATFNRAPGGSVVEQAAQAVWVQVPA